MNEKDKTKLIINAFGNDSWESYEKLKEELSLLDQIMIRLNSNRLLM